MDLIGDQTKLRTELLNWNKRRKYANIYNVRYIGNYGDTNRNIKWE